jgi:hypothetical protein
VSGRLTAACPYQHGLHRIRFSSRRGRIRTDAVVLPKHADCRLPTRRVKVDQIPFQVWQAASALLHQKSTQRESNPHFRHGKAVGCRYIMGAFNPGRVVKDRIARAQGGTRTHVAALRRRSLSLWTTRAWLCFSCLSSGSGDQGTAGFQSLESRELKGDRRRSALRHLALRSAHLFSLPSPFSCSISAADRGRNWDQTDLNRHLLG